MSVWMLVFIFGLNVYVFGGADFDFHDNGDDSFDNNFNFEDTQSRFDFEDNEGNKFDFKGSEGNKFDFGMLEEDLLRHIKAETPIEVNSQVIDNLNFLEKGPDKSEEDDLKFRVKRLQSFHKDLASSDGPTFGVPIAGLDFQPGKSSAGSALESDINQLMKKHGVTVEMIEGKSEEDTSDFTDLGDGVFGMPVLFSDSKEVTIEQLLKRVKYLEDNFHKEDIEGSSDPCSSNPCRNGGDCSVVDKSYTCHCDGNFYGKNCENQDEDECKKGTHNCDNTTSTCSNTVGSFICQCKEGFFDSENGCSDVDECSEGTHNCDDKTSTCLNKVGSFTCLCRDGFFDNGKGCSDIDECSEGTHNCDDKTSTCLNTVGSFTCQCKDGFFDNGKGCSDVDECSERTHNCDDTTSTCSNTIGSFTCQCKKGFFDNGKGCSDVDECEYGTHDCEKKTSTCKNTFGSFTCQCKKGFVDYGLGCSDENECRMGTHDCDEKTSVCLNTFGSFACRCKNGFADNGMGCTDIDECKKETDNCDDTMSTCSNTIGSFTCQCKDGFFDNGKGCSDIDECSEGTHSCKNVTSVCINTVGSFECQCRKGFNAVQDGCFDIDECSMKTDTCDYMTSSCVNTDGSFYCECVQGYVKSGDQCIEDSGASGYTGNVYNTDLCNGKCDKDTSECVGDDNFAYCECKYGYIDYGYGCTQYTTSLDVCADCDNDTATCVTNMYSSFCDCKEGYIFDGLGCIAVGCLNTPTLFGAVIIEISEDSLYVKFSCGEGYRNRGGYPSAICSKVTGVWELPTMICEPTECFIRVEGHAYYAGKQNKARSNSMVCGRFDSPELIAEKKEILYPYYFHVSDISDVNDYCRDPFSSGTPWCFTNVTGRTNRSCDIPMCEPGSNCTVAPFVPGASVASMTKDADGTVSATYECLDGLVQVNNPVAVCKGDKGGDEEWTVANVICAPKDCYMLVRDSRETLVAAYSGRQNKTISGLECQRWEDADEDTTHFVTGESVRDAGSYCRDGVGRLKPWCYTTRTYTSWEYCSVRPCSFMNNM